MKKIKHYSLKKLYSLLSFFSDSSKGNKMFVNWKTSVGIILIGMQVSSCKQKPTNEAGNCYAPVVDTTAVNPSDTAKHTKTIQSNGISTKKRTAVPPDVPKCYKAAIPDERIMCYEMAAPVTPDNPIEIDSNEIKNDTTKK